ncbi:MAG: ThuA domain-containing protein [Phycisphaerae bacterium]
MIRFAVAAILVLTLMASSLRAQASSDQPPARKIKLLVITGGHGFNKDGFHKLLAALPNTVVTEATEGDFKQGHATAYDRPDLLTFDAVLLYDFQLNITPDEQKNLHALFEKGVGLICLHHALLSYQDWPEYERIVGGLYLLDSRQYPDKTWPASTYQGDADMDITVVDRNHPVTAGISDFRLKDEIYRGVHTTLDIHPLLSCEGKPLVWCRDEKNSHVVTFIIGHGPGTWENPTFLKLLGNSLHWVAKK